MKLWILYAVLALVGIPLLFINMPIALGWMIGHVVMATLSVLRERYYAILLTKEKFSFVQYASYLIFVIVLIALPLGVSFYIPQHINPYALFVAYFVDRFINFGWNLFVKEEANAS